MQSKRFLALAYADGTTLSSHIPATATSGAKYARETKVAFDADPETTGFKWGMGDTEEEAIASAEAKL